MKFEIIENKFYKNGEETRVISVAIHYFRLLKNNIETGY